MTSRRAYRSSLSTDSLAFLGALCICATAIPAMMPMMAMTIRSSIRVKPRSWRKVSVSPLPVLVLRAVQPFAGGRGVHVVAVLVSPCGRVGLVVVGAHAPLLRLDHRVEGDPSQELDLLPQGPGLLDAFHQRVEVGRVALRVDAALLDDTGVAELLVQIDRLPHGPQIPAQLQLLLALHRELADRDKRPGQDRHHGDRDQQLDERDPDLVIPADGAHGSCPGTLLTGR